MEETVKIPESLDSFVKERLGLDLTTILKNNEPLKLKEKLEARVITIPENHYGIETPVVLDKDVLIKIIGPSDNSGSFQPIGYTNIVKFQLVGLTFPKVNCKIWHVSCFNVTLESLVKALS